MAGKIVIDTERCKGCGLCITVCPKNGILVSNESNKNGYFPSKFECKDCTGCSSCAIICPEAAIQVFMDERIVSLDQQKKIKPALSKSKS